MSSKLKKYTEGALTPLLKLKDRHGEDFLPYLLALSQGLKKGSESLLHADATQPEVFVGNLLKEASEGMMSAGDKLGQKHLPDLESYLSLLTKRRSSVMFGVSYLGGLFFGKLSRELSELERQKALH